jgi:hypothetical protein
MRINVAIPESHVEAPPLDAALEAVTRLNETLLRDGHVPTARDAIEKDGVRWKPEPPGDEHFDHAHTVHSRGWGDCDDLAPWHAASLRHTGEDPGAEAIVRRSGPQRWHAVVKRSDGTIDDPSREAGMGAPRGVNGAWLPLMSQPASVSGAYAVRPQIAMRPVRGAFQARADMPWQWKEHLDEPPTPTDYAMTTLHTAPVASTALVGALDGACRLALAGGYADPEHINRLACLADACEGADYDHLAEVYGEEHANAAKQIVGSFFGSLFKAVTAPIRAVTHLPIIKNIVPLAKFIPGVGPAASAALSFVDAAGRAVPQGHPAATHAVVATHPQTGQVVPPHVVHAAAANAHMPAAQQRFGAVERAQALKVLLEGHGGYPCASFG